MITYTTARYSGNLVYRKGVCLRTDTKPTTDKSMMNGSELEEMDTGKLYIYDAENATWQEWTGGGGASGAWCKKGTFTAGEIGTNQVIEFGKTLSDYLFIIEMDDNSKTSLLNSEIDATRLYSVVGIYPSPEIANQQNPAFMYAARINPSTSALSATYANFVTCANDSITIPTRDVTNTSTCVYSGYTYNYYIVEIK